MITIKTKEEIELLKEGGKRLKKILTTLSGMVAPGISTQSFEDKARELLVHYGDTAAFLNYTPAGADRPFPAALCLALNDEIVHGIPNEEPKILEEGDIVTLDMGLVHKGMFVDSAVTVPVGAISKEATLLLKANKEALEAGIAASIGGNRIGDIGAAIWEVMERYELSQAEDLCGHGVGYAVHEDPFVPNFGTIGKGVELLPGMVIAIEPLFTLDKTKNGKAKIVLEENGYTYSTKSGALSAHFEHTLVITDDAPIVVTR